MSNPVKILAAVVMVAGVAITPASAASWQQQQPAQFQTVQFGFGMQRGDNRRDRFDRRDRDDRGNRFERRGNSYYFNGFRGSRERRSGWRQFNGWWFPQSAFSVTINLGNERRSAPARLSRAHVEWCYDNYRSYRASDNTFQPYNGPRRACVSPYSR